MSEIYFSNYKFIKTEKSNDIKINETISISIFENIVYYNGLTLNNSNKGWCYFCKKISDWCKINYFVNQYYDVIYLMENIIFTLGNSSNWKLRDYISFEFLEFITIFPQFSNIQIKNFICKYQENERNNHKINNLKKEILKLQIKIKQLETKISDKNKENLELQHIIEKNKNTIQNYQKNEKELINKINSYEEIINNIHIYLNEYEDYKLPKMSNIQILNKCCDLIFEKSNKKFMVF